jgi:hypothetical protein
MIDLGYETNLTKLSHYVCDGKIFHGKIEAIMHSEKCNKPVDFYFHDDIYSRCDWSVEPTDSLEQLYLRRMQELRQQYDYLVLHFSGGHDSCNILEICMKYNIFIDELYLHAPLAIAVKDINVQTQANASAEIYFTSIPLAEYARDNFFPRMKITLHDTTPHIINFWKNAKNWHEDWKMPDFSPVNSIKQAWDDIHVDLKKIVEKGQTIGHVFGVEKPGIYYKNGQYFIRFLDQFLNSQFPYRSTTNKNQLPQFYEPFYWGDSCAEIIIKQGHAIKNHIKANRLDPAKTLAISGTPRHHFLAKLIYNRKLPLPFYPDKDTVQIKGMDEILLKDQNTDYYKNWKTGVDEIRKLMPAHWIHETVNKGIVGVYSKSYCLGS